MDRWTRDLPSLHTLSPTHHPILMLLSALALWLGSFVSGCLAYSRSFVHFFRSTSQLQTQTSLTDTEIASGPFLVNSIKPEAHEWADAFGTTISDPRLEGSSFSLVTYNLLAPINGEGVKHAYAKESITRWSRRREKLVEELKRLKADVFCLQEVSLKGLRETFIPKLQPYGYDCCAYAPAKKSDRGRGKYAHRQIGCAVLIRSSKIRLLNATRIHLRDYTPVDSCFSHKFVVDVQSRFDAMAIVHLQLTATNQTFIVCNAHFYWNPARPDIKAVQALAAIEAVKSFSTSMGYASFHDVPIIMSGDLNTMPTNIPYQVGSFEDTIASAPFEIFTHGCLASTHPEHPDSYYSKVEKGTNPKLGSFNTKLSLSNIYCLSEFEPQKPFFTTKTDEFAGWIDHIWVSSNIDVTHVLVPPIRSGDLEANLKARKFTPIPSLRHPSDHLPIGMIATLR